MKEQFQRLIEHTDGLLRHFRLSKETDDLKEFERLLEAREDLLKDLRDRLRVHKDIEPYRQDYESWRLKEKELTDLVKDSLLDLQNKTNKMKSAQSVTRQYNSYLRQMPFGAFLDKKE